MLTEQRRLREYRASLSAEANSLIPPPGGYWSDERRKKFDGLMEEHDSISRHLQSIEGNGAPPNGQIGLGDGTQSRLRRIDARAQFLPHSETWFGALRDYL